MINKNNINSWYFSKDQPIVIYKLYIFLNVGDRIANRFILLKHKP